MSVMNMNSRMAMAEKLSIPQLQQAIQSGSIPAYIGVPLIEQKVRAQKQASVPPAPQQKPIAQEVMEQASGIDSVPSNLPVSGYADGGIVAFADGGDVEDYEEYLEQKEEAEYEDAIRRYMSELESAGIEGIPVNRTKKVEQKYAQGGIARFYNGGSIEAANAALGMGDLEQINPMLARTNVPQPLRFLADGDRLKTEPAYRNWVAEGGLNGDARWETFLESGNEPYESVNLPNDDPRLNPYLPEKPSFDEKYQRDLDRHNLNKAQNIALSADREFTDATKRAVNSGINYLYRGVNALGGDISLIPKDKTLSPEFIKNFGKETRRLNSVSDEDPLASAGDLNQATRPPVRTADAELDNRMLRDSYNPPVVSGAPSPKGGTQAPSGRSTPVGNQGIPQLGSSSADGSRSTGSFAGESTRSERPKSAFDAFIEDIKASREDLKKQQAQDKYMALLSAGLGMMSGTSPNAFANIGQGAQAGVASYGASQKQRAAERAALNKNLLMGQRYQSMEDIANRTADINEMRYREAAAARAAGAGEGAYLKEQRILDQREAALARAIQQGQATVANALKAQFGDTGMYTNKAAFEKAYKDLTAEYVTPHVLKRNQLDRQRFPDLFEPSSQPQSGGSSGNRLRVDKNGNIIQ